MAQAKSKMTPILAWEWVLVLSPIPVMVLAYIVLANTTVGEGAVAFEGSMIDLPVVERARRLLERAARWSR